MNLTDEVTFIWDYGEPGVIDLRIGGHSGATKMCRASGAFIRLVNMTNSRMITGVYDVHHRNRRPLGDVGKTTTVLNLNTVLTYVGRGVQVVDVGTKATFFRS